MESDAYGGLAHAEVRGKRGVGRIGPASRKARAELFKKRHAPRGDVLLAQALRDTGEKRESPRVIESAIGRQIGRRCAGESHLHGLRVEGRKEMSSAFLGASMVAEIGKVMIKGPKEKGSETAAVAIDTGE